MTEEVLRIENLHKKFGDAAILKGIDLTVRRGEQIVILGSSGSGKSTLLRCVNFLEKPTAGRIYLAGQLIGRPRGGAGNGDEIVYREGDLSAVPMPTHTAYAASKGGISSMTKAVSLALAPHGIRVNAIGPGTIETDLTRARLLSDPASRDRILSRTPLGRFGTPADVAAVAAFLASDDAAYITGQTIYLDGGRMGLNYVMPAASH